MHAATLLLSLALAAPAPADWPTRQEIAVARELQTFPSLRTADEVCDFLPARREWLAGQRELWPDHYYYPYFDAVTQDNEDRCMCWQLLRCARRAAVNQQSRVETTAGLPDLWFTAPEALAMLRARLGEGAFRDGVMPASADARWFRRVD